MKKTTTPKTTTPKTTTEPKKTTEARKPKTVEKIEVTNEILLAVAEKALSSEYQRITVETDEGIYQIRVKHLNK